MSLLTTNAKLRSFAILDKFLIIKTYTKLYLERGAKCSTLLPELLWRLVYSGL